MAKLTPEKRKKMEKLIYDTEKYLNRQNKYYFHCKNGVKSKEVVMSLEQKGYNVTQVI